MSDEKFSQFSLKAVINPTDEIVGLQSGDNARWEFSTIASSISVVQSITGTINQVIVDNTDPLNPILSAPQDINTGATPTFFGEILQSNSLATFPIFKSFQSQIPPSFQQMSQRICNGKDSLGNENPYLEENVYSWNATSGNISSRVDNYAFSNGLKRLITRFSGENTTLGAGGLFTLNCPTTFSSHNVDGIVNLGASSGTFANQITVGFDATLPLQLVTFQQLQNAIVGIYKLQGNYNPNITNLFPVASNTTNPVSATILAGMLWVASSSGNLNGVPVDAGDNIIALVNNPGQASSNWTVVQNNIGYTPLSNVLTSSQIFVGNASNIAVGVTPSNDITITNTGDVTINKIQTEQSSDNFDMPLGFFLNPINSRQQIFLNTSLSFNPSFQIFKSPNLYCSNGDGGKFFLVGDNNSVKIGTTSYNMDLYAGSIPFGAPNGGEFSFKTLTSSVFTEKMNLNGTRLFISPTTPSTSIVSGSIVNSGGIGNAGAFYNGGIARILDTTFASTAFTGALVIGNGINSVGIGGGNISTTGGISSGTFVTVGSGGVFLLTGRTDKRLLVTDNGGQAVTSNLADDIDVNSPLLNSAQPLFSAFLTASQVDITGSGTQALVICDSATVNVGSYYNTITGLFTAPKTGKYFFSGSAVMGGGITNSHTLIKAYVTAGAVSVHCGTFTGAVRDSNGQIIIPVSVTMNLLVGTTVGLFILGSGATATIDAIGGLTNVGVCNFQGFLVA